MVKTMPIVLNNCELCSPVLFKLDAGNKRATAGHALWYKASSDISRHTALHTRAADHNIAALLQVVSNIQYAHNHKARTSVAVHIVHL